MTKKQAKARKEAWQAALKEGRVVRINPLTLKSYPTIEQAHAAAKMMNEQGIRAELIQVKESI